METAKSVEQLNDEFLYSANELKRAANAYDLGNYNECNSMAVQIVKLLGDRFDAKGKPKRNFISLTTTMGRKPATMVDLSLQGWANSELHGPICAMGLHLEGCAGLTPFLDGFLQDQIAPPDLPFDEWWNATILRDCVGNEFTRRRIVETMRDQIAAHSDDSLEATYAGVAYQEGLGVKQAIASNDENMLDPNPARVIVRQIAHEVLRTFDPALKFTPIRDRNRKILPVVLSKIVAIYSDGRRELVTDHCAIHFDLAMTSDPEIWEEWKRTAPQYEERTQPHAPSDGHFRNRASWEIQQVYLNYAPYELQVTNTMVAML